jgi:hypothetical protein
MVMTTQLEPPLEPPPNKSRQRWALGLGAAVLIGIAAWPAASYINALAYPGEASFTVRTVEWGSTHIQVQYTWRSGLGVDAAGNLIYVGGGGMNLTTLAAALMQAGAVRGMQLDIHTEMVDFLTYPVGADHAAYGVKLMPDMAGGANRYLLRVAP